MEGYRKLLDHLQKWQDRDKANGVNKLHNVFRTLINDFKKAFQEYDKNMKEDEYDPNAAKPKKSLSPSSLKLKLKLSNGDESSAKKEKNFKKESKIEKLPKKDAKYVKNIFTKQTQSGRQLKPSEWVKDSVGNYIDNRKHLLIPTTLLLLCIF